MKKDIKNIRASIRAKLQNKAKETNRPFAEVLQYFGIERFLYKPLNSINKADPSQPKKSEVKCLIR